MNPIPFGTGLPPALIFIIGALFIPLLRGRIKSAFMLLLPIAAFYVIFTVPEGDHWQFSLIGYDLVLGRVDRLSRAFGYIFAIISFISLIYALKVDDDLQYVSGLCYAGGALGVTFAGDLFTLYIFWEVMAVASTFLILARRTRPAQAAAFRYIMIHVLGGLCLLAGIDLYVHRTGSIEFGHMTLAGADTWLIFIGIAVNAAIPPLHPWLKDAYPEATVAGAVFLSAFTTKSAVYVMARTFAGTEILIWLGALMTLIPIVYAVLENDIRRILAYSLINQIGFMMCGIGIGTELAINGAVAHAFCHILYKALLFMAAGSILHVTGRIRCTDLGGLYKTMPLTCLFCIVGAASISALPLFNGFVSKSMIISAAAYGHLAVIWLMLQFASAVIVPYVKVPYFAFFGRDSSIRAEEPPLNMLIAMGIAAALCVLLGIFPGPLYRILPYPVEYDPYTVVHVVEKLQLTLFGLLAFCLLMLSGYYPAEMRAVHLDVDWFYRKGGGTLYRLMDQGFNRLNSVSDDLFARKLPERLAYLAREGPALLLALFASRFKTMKGDGEAELDDHKRKIQTTFDTLSVPIGLGAAAAALFLVLLVWIN